MNATEQLITKFYSAFQQKDFLVMQSCYHPHAIFSDPVFRNLNAMEVKAMWEMLLTSSKDLRIEFNNIHTNDQSGSAHWEAWYSFSRTGRQVHNIIDATFEFRDGLIYKHRDHFSFWRWSRQALGTNGTLLGWTPFLHNKVHETARRSLGKFMQQ